jgi:SP family arabinose:H+ symporter-like MFS transporter
MGINSLKQGNAFYVTFICIIAALGGLLFGYDTAVIADAIGFLTQKFGLSPTMKGWAASCILIGCIAGVIVAGNFSDKLGRKRTLYTRRNSVFHIIDRLGAFSNILGFCAV